MTDIVERLLNRALAAAIIKDKPDLYNDAADAIIRLRAENKKLCDALIDAAGELQHAYIMGFTERYRYAARAARNAVAAIRESGE